MVTRFAKRHWPRDIQIPLARRNNGLVKYYGTRGVLNQYLKITGTNKTVQKITYKYMLFYTYYTHTHTPVSYTHLACVVKLIRARLLSQVRRARLVRVWAPLVSVVRMIICCSYFTNKKRLIRVSSDK